MREEYNGSITVGFNGMPAIELETLNANRNASSLERFSSATKRRRFTLKEDWEIDLGDIDYVEELNGTIVIPKNDTNSNPNVFDGASVPVPWLVSLLTLGVLRPLGVMLIGSILHDYAYSHGNLWVKGNEKNRKVILERHHADRLFRDVIGTANSLPLVGYVAWLAVRLGWVWVPYNNSFHTGRKPYPEYMFVMFILIALILVGLNLGFNVLLYIFLGGYLILYVTSLLLQRRYR